VEVGAARSRHATSTALTHADADVVVVVDVGGLDRH